MQRKNQFVQLILVMFFIVIPPASFAQELDKQDPYLWLEEVDGDRATAWVEEQNRKTIDRLSSDNQFASIRDQLKAIFDGDGRLSNSTQYRGMLYELNVTADHPRGVLRRTPLDSYAANEPDWINLVDLDALSKQDGKSWFLSISVLNFSPSGKRVILPLSDGGADEVVLREYDLVANKFVEGGFNATLSRAAVRWLDEDTLVIAAAFDANEKTVTGDARVIRKWARGTNLAEAPVLLEVDPEHLTVVPTVIESADSRHILLADIAGRTQGALHALAVDGRLTRLDVPGGFAFFGQINNLSIGDRWVMKLEADWIVDEETFPADSMVSIQLDKMIRQGGDPSGTVSLIYSPPDGASLEFGLGAVATKDALYIHVLEHVTSRIIRAELEKSGKWQFSDVVLPSDFGTASLPSSDPHAREFLLGFESFIISPSEHLVGRDGKLKQVRKVAEQIEAYQFISERHFATAADGTRVPYFVVRSNKTKYEGSAPTLMFGYGSFGVVFQPRYDVAYIGPAHKIWLEQGGVFVSVHGRGGGEYGPEWHQAAKGVNRQTSYDDIYAVTEDLIEQGITSRGKVGFIGGSSGGLTSATLATQRPDLFGAAISLVPITDMLRYHLLFAGRNWVDEYGNPDIPVERAALLAHSPYHNIFKDRTYPEIFLLTSTRDDRVHPGHARKMAAKMIDQGHPVLFYEAPEGGHRMAINNEGRAFNAALIMVYLRQKLMDDSQE